jgi:hypothetical protein
MLARHRRSRGAMPYTFESGWDIGTFRRKPPEKSSQELLLHSRDAATEYASFSSHHGRPEKENPSCIHRRRRPGTTAHMLEKRAPSDASTPPHHHGRPGERPPLTWRSTSPPRPGRRRKAEQHLCSTRRTRALLKKRQPLPARAAPTRGAAPPARSPSSARSDRQGGAPHQIYQAHSLHLP